MSKIITKEVFTFNELSIKAQNQAIFDHINFFLEVIPYEDMSIDMQKACDKAEKMQTPWFTGSYIYDYCQQEIIDDIILNEYYFDNNGILN